MTFDDQKRLIEHTPPTDAEAAVQRVLDEYPADWDAIAARIKAAAGGKCERCQHVHEVATGYVLTVHHLDGVKSNCADWNLAALCQRCHLHIQGKVKMDQLFFINILEVSPWFKPHLHGYLASLKAGQQAGKPAGENSGPLACGPAGLPTPSP